MLRLSGKRPTKYIIAIVYILRKEKEGDLLREKTIESSFGKNRILYFGFYSDGLLKVGKVCEVLK